jgi:glutamate N-acetyltransferase/amino-acid N-acetyltransferase
MPPVSPLAPPYFPAMPSLAGVRMASTNCGIRYKSRKDLLLMAFDDDTAVAGVFTTSKTASAPVLRCRRHLAGKIARGLLVNSGNSNAFTGAIGEQAVNQTLGAASALLGCEAEEMFVASTGVIGEPLPYERILEALPDLHPLLQEDGWEGAAQAIMTTDTFPKGATRTAIIGGVEVTLNGIAKGSGMIAPDMATMLAFMATDAAIPADLLQTMLVESNARSFNAITVDSDTSTSDTALLFATGKAGNPVATTHDHYADFHRALDSLMADLALQIVRDGEGATKLVTVVVTGAESPPAAKQVAMAIANSPLVKTAIAGEDPNWGRVVMAVGKSGERAERDLLKIWFGPTLVAEKGMLHKDYHERIVAQYMKGQELEIRVDLGIGSGEFTAYTCDLTENYIKINASYRS